jgi:hypothetical protein
MTNRKKVRTIDWLFKNYLSFFEQYGMSRQNILNHYDEWKINKVDRIEDYVWYIFNFLLNENAKQSTDTISFYKRNNDIYCQMLLYRRKIEGKPANEIQRALNSNRLRLKIETVKYEFNVVVIGANDCEFSKDIDKNIYTVKEALDDKIIPYNECSRKQGCSCLYSIKFKTDENNRLIRKN